VADRYVIAAPLSGRLARIALREGDRVEAGMVVAILAPTLSPLMDARTMAEQRGRVETADAGVARAAAGSARARVGLEQARAELKRSEQLSQQGFVSATKLDTDKLALQAAQKELDAAVQAGHMAQHELQTARAALVAVQQGPARGGDFAVKAPVAGTLLRLVQASEAPVALGTPLLEIGDTSRLEVVAELLTTDALQIAPGAPVRIERWGGPGELQGRVRMIEPAAVTKVSALGVEEQRVKVLIDLTSPPALWKALGDGYRVTVRVVAESHAKVLRVPASAVFPRTDGQAGMAVFREVGGRAHLTPVELGGRNGSLAWLRGGLAAGESVIVYPPAAVTDGVRVQPRALKPAVSSRMQTERSA
jgi:HlyD family secretion protein